MSDHVEEIFEWLYEAYGSDSGVLLGIPASYQSAIKIIIELVLEEEAYKREEEGERNDA